MSSAWEQSAATVTFERLLGAWTSGGHEALEESTSEWTFLLRSLGVDDVDDTIVRRLLMDNRDSHPGAMVGDAIENYDEVAAQLKEAGEPYVSMLHGKAARELDLLAPTYLLGYGSQQGGRTDAL